MVDSTHRTASVFLINSFYHNNISCLLKIDIFCREIVEMLRSTSTSVVDDSNSKWLWRLLARSGQVQSQVQSQMSSSIDGAYNEPRAAVKHEFPTCYDYL